MYSPPTRVIKTENQIEIIMGNEEDGGEQSNDDEKDEQSGSDYDVDVKKSNRNAKELISRF